MIENRFNPELISEATIGENEVEESAISIIEGGGEDVERSNPAEDNQRESVSYNQTTEEHDPMSSAIATSSDYQRMSSVTCDNPSAAIGSPDVSFSDSSTLNSRQSMLTIDEGSRQVLANAMVHFVNRVPPRTNRNKPGDDLEEKSSSADSISFDELSDNYPRNSVGTNRTPSPALAYKEEGPLTPASQLSVNNDSIDSATKKSILISSLINGESINPEFSAEKSDNQEISQRRILNQDTSKETNFNGEERRSRIMGHLLIFSRQKEAEEGQVMPEETSDCLLSATAAELFQSPQVTVFSPFPFFLFEVY